MLGVPENTIILSCIREYMKEYNIMPYDEESHTGLVRHVLIRKGFRTGQIMICLVINGSVRELKAVDILIKRLTGLFDPKKMEEEKKQNRADQGAHVKTIVCSVNREKTNVILGKENYQSFMAPGSHNGFYRIHTIQDFPAFLLSGKSGSDRKTI